MRVAMLTGGGDCPGLNAVIRAVVRKGETQYEHEVLGYRHGWRGLIEGESRPLTVASTRGLLPRGGTILGTSRTNPYNTADGADDRVEAGAVTPAGQHADTHQDLPTTSSIGAAASQPGGCPCSILRRAATRRLDGRRLDGPRLDGQRSDGVPATPEDV